MELLGSSSSDEEEVSFKINTNYAKNYEKWRRKEEKQRLLDKYGEQESTDSSEEEEIRSTPQMDKDWLRAYAVVRFKQARLYKEGERFFKDTAQPVSKKKEKATTLKDHERKFILEKGGIDEEIKAKPVVGKSYFEEQEEIKQSLKEAIGDSSANESEEEEDLLVKAHKTDEQKQEEENEYLEWLKGERESLGDPDAEAELAPLKQYWNDPSLDEKEKVLRDYILNNGYMDQEDSDSESDNEEGPNLKEAPDPEEEEKFLEKAELYEHKYNFRHEEPGGDEIKSYPRVIDTSVRTKDTRRAEKRKQKLERKNKEKEKMKEEVRLLQKLQMEEKMEKLEKLRKIAHRPDLDYDLEADFDPEEHNKIMKKYFDDNYYEDEHEERKPKFDYDAAIDEEEDDWWKERLQEEQDGIVEDEEDDNDDGNDATGNAYGQNEEELDADDPNFIVSCLCISSQKKKKLKSRKVVPNDYGLTTEEILSLPDRELNAWVSVKKMSQHRTAREEAEERRRFQARAKDIEKKKKILPSLFTEQDEKPETLPKKKKKKKRNKRKLESEDEAASSAEPDELQNNTELLPTKKRKKSHSLSHSSLNESSENQAKSSQVQKFGKKIKNKIFDDQESTTNDVDIVGKLSKSDKLKNQKLKTSGKKKEKVKDLEKNLGNEGSADETKQQLLNNDKLKHVKKKNNTDQSISSAKPESAKVLPSKQNKDSGDSQANDSHSTKQLKKKRKLKSNGDEQKRKRRKLSIKMNKKLADNAETVTDNKSLERQLSKIMSASRLSKYGLGPNVAKGAKKKKKKKLTT
ncbi:protein kri1 homolog [Plakobranchus ocellatus]|uniref:Protein KRI1 homolog n=1 Tax=Plakobranchus ocellatus TaxID=259542 RepID=A0AAV3ZHY8_9GAST|nr:protein kri1 homolog [Plakobranchus ocellatus]